MDAREQARQIIEHVKKIDSPAAQALVENHEKIEAWQERVDRLRELAEVTEDPIELTQIKHDLLRLAVEGQQLKEETRQLLSRMPHFN